MAENSRQQWTQYDIMHGERRVAVIARNGVCRVEDAAGMPYHLYLEEGTDMDVQIQNLDNFYHWCASRVLMLDRQYAKEILNSIGAVQGTTDKVRARVALSYHCLSLLDIFWVKEASEQVTFRELNLYENRLDTAFVDVSLRGRQMTIENSHLIAEDLSTPGCFPKAWIRRDGTFYLLKDGGGDAVTRELLASKICRCFRCNQVLYESEVFEGELVTVSRLMTSLDQSIVPMEHFAIYAANQEIDRMQFVLELDSYSYYMMNILDYLVGNTDRHWGNWGFLLDNRTNQPIRLHDLMDFNRAFEAYDRIEGANCLTTFDIGNKQTQMEAALEAVKKVGLNQIAPVQETWFEDDGMWKMFQARLGELTTAAKQGARWT